MTIILVCCPMALLWSNVVVVGLGTVGWLRDVGVAVTLGMFGAS